MAGRQRTSVRTSDEPRSPAHARRRTNADEPGRLTELEDRLARLEKGPGLHERGHALRARVMPDQTVRHFRNAGRENLLGLRSLIDFWIERVDEPGDQPDPRSRHEPIEIV